ncbi:hypothetical protein WJX72_011306 [[Myrmecia] bisecta]|uniref:Uncharacterized protein n=1 Tax=[Myrmecia] bisecta TaxID=41462 RepID=A0AAW1PL13_9CHLO
MAGINRLGKGPAKPGSFRPPDPNKYRTTDHFSEGTEGDADYQRMVQDIEDTQQSQVGWLFGRGAFDKGDLLYLRDEEEKKRFHEQELRDNERLQFNTLRTKLDSAGPSVLVPPPRPPKKPPGLAKAGLKLVPKVVVKPASATAPAATAQAQPAGPPAKKQRVDDTPGQATAAASKAATGGASPASTSKAQPADDDSEGGGLPGLLGDYGSESDSEDEANGQPADGGLRQSPQKHSGQTKQPP